jgi:hypothetical protein
MDTTGQCFALTVYNMAEDAIRAEDDVTIPDAVLQRIALTVPPGLVPEAAGAAEPAAASGPDGSLLLSYPAIRVDQPAALLVNGKLLGALRY